MKESDYCVKEGVISSYYMCYMCEQLTDLSLFLYRFIQVLRCIWPVDGSRVSLGIVHQAPLLWVLAMHVQCLGGDGGCCQSVVRSVKERHCASCVCKGRRLCGPHWCHCEWVGGASNGHYIVHINSHKWHHFQLVRCCEMAKSHSLES